MSIINLCFFQPKATLPQVQAAQGLGWKQHWLTQRWAFTSKKKKTRNSCIALSQMWTSHFREQHSFCGAAAWLLTYSSSHTLHSCCWTFRERKISQQFKVEKQSTQWHRNGKVRSVFPFSLAVILFIYIYMYMEGIYVYMICWFDIVRLESHFLILKRNYHFKSRC